MTDGSGFELSQVGARGGEPGIAAGHHAPDECGQRFAHREQGQYFRVSQGNGDLITVHSGHRIAAGEEPRRQLRRDAGGRALPDPLPPPTDEEVAELDGK
ncbi:hypothetical protein GCM10009754_86560 [Amycolatopsis minnesotensis]|uniref:DUF1508 domain-containing protein n=1 Tax=Amycolatopsis minnesotensis TaxID=337894 RepID=A0ABN2SWV8_9PSEU